MALIRDFTLDGVNYPQAYSRILQTRCDKNDAYVYVITYASFEERMAGAEPIWTEDHGTVLQTVAHDVFPASYAFVKTQPGYENAIDHNNPPEAPAPELN